MNVPEQKTPDVIVNIPETTVKIQPANVTVNVPKGITRVDSPVTINVPQQTAPIVNIQPADVTVNVPKQDTPIVNVEAPKVTVSPVVKIPTTTEETNVIRDKNGLITSTTKRTTPNG